MQIILNTQLFLFGQPSTYQHKTKILTKSITKIKSIGATKFNNNILKLIFYASVIMGIENNIEYAHMQFKYSIKFSQSRVFINKVSRKNK